MLGLLYPFNLDLKIDDTEYSVKIFISGEGAIILDAHDQNRDEILFAFIENWSRILQKFIRSERILKERIIDAPVGRAALQRAQAPFDRYLLALHGKDTLPAWVWQALSRTFNFAMMTSGLMMPYLREWPAVKIGALSLGCLAACVPYSWRRTQTALTSMALMSTVFGASTTFLMTLMSLGAKALSLSESFATQKTILEWVAISIAGLLAGLANFQPSSKMLIGQFVGVAADFKQLTEQEKYVLSSPELRQYLAKLDASSFARTGRAIVLKKGPQYRDDAEYAPHVVVPPKLSTAIMRIASQAASIASKSEPLGVPVSTVMGAIAVATVFSFLHYLVDVRLDFFGNSVPSLAEKAPCCAWIMKALSEATELLLAGTSAALNMGMIGEALLSVCGVSVFSLAAGVPVAAVSGLFGMGVMLMVAYLRGQYSINPFGAGTQGAMQEATHQAQRSATGTFLARAAAEVLPAISSPDLH